MTSGAAGGQVPARGFRSAWRHRRWRWLLASVVVSLAGDLLYWVALIAFLVDGAGAGEGASWVAVALLARLVPSVLLGPFGGTVADRMDRRRLLVGLDLARAAVFLAMAAVIAVDGSRILAVGLVALSAAASTVYRPALVAAAPFLVTEDDLGAANAAQASLAQLSLFVGPALGAALVAVMDPAIVVGIDAATFVVSALLVSRIGDVGGGRRSWAFGGSEAPAGVLRETVEGFTVVARDRGLVALVGLATVVLFAFGAQQVLYVLVARDRLGLGAEGIGVLMAAAGLGGILAAPFTGRLASSPRLGWVAGASGIATTAPLVLMAFVEVRSAAYALAVVEGAAAIVYEIALLTLLQRAVTEDVMGRVFSVQEAFEAIGETVGSVLAPVLAATVGLGVALGAVGATGVLVSLLTVPALVVLGVRLEARRAELRGMSDWLGRLGEFDGMDLVGRERLARSATELDVAAGTVVLAEGALPDHLYVVRSGRLRVTTAAAGAGPIPDLGPDDVFGEIGLLRGMPRTATVTAVEPCGLLRIDGRVFRSVALGEATRIDPFTGGMRARLGRTHPHLADDLAPTEAPR